MPKEVVIPVMGLTMEAGTIVEWLKTQGDVVEKDEPLFLLQTDKAIVEVPCPASGVLSNILLPSDQMAAVGTVAAMIALPDEPYPVTSSVAASSDPVPEPAAPGQSVTSTELAAGRESVGHGRSSPAARRLARERGIDLAQVRGTGPQGRILTKDVETAAAAPSRHPRKSHEVPGQGVSRRPTAEKMVQAWQAAPMVTLFGAVTMDAAYQLYVQVKSTWQEDQGIDLKWDAVMIKAVALALRRHGALNAKWVDENIVLASDVNVGFAVQADTGLLTPVVHAADGLTLIEVAREVGRLIEGARAGRLRATDLTGETFTITNLGGYGVSAFTPIINLPCAAILGIGAISHRVQMRDERPVAVREIQLSLTFDHRVVDGAPAAEFLRTVTHLLEEPYRLLV